MSLPPIDDMAALHDRMDAAEKQNEIWLEHHRMLAQQIAELTIAMQRLAKQQGEMEQRIPELMAAGIVRAVGNPATWQAGREAMRRQAREAAGGWLLGGLRFAFDKLMWVGVAFLAIYTLGGWPAIAAIMKIQTTVQP